MDRFILIFNDGTFKVVNEADILKEMLVADPDIVTGLIRVGLDVQGRFEETTTSLKMKVEIKSGWNQEVTK